MSAIKLTSLSHGGGCGCKISPAILESILNHAKEKMPFPGLLVGSETSDDAAVFQINSEQAIVATTDFFMPIVDDAFHFGQIAASNALSDIYAMGGKPLMALAIVGMPVNVLPVETIRDILAGGESICHQAGIPIAGGHSIDSPEPIYGLVAIGIVHPKSLKRNKDAQAGDCLILGKGLGVGILAQAMKKDLLSESGYQTLIKSTTQLNTVGQALADIAEVHALTDVTGFALLGHLWELARAANLRAHLDMSKISILPEVEFYAKQGIGPGAIERNLASFGEHIEFDPNLAAWQKSVLLDPQTSGGLLVSVAKEKADQVLALFKEAGFEYAAQVGYMSEGTCAVAVHAS